MGDVINLDGDVAKKHVSNLNEEAAALPSSDVVSEVRGNSTEPAAMSFTSRLQSASMGVGMSVEGLRTFVSQNAEALTRAVEALRASDQMNADAARDATAMIDEMSGTTGGGSGGSGAPGGGSGTPTDPQSRTTSAFQNN